ncbi:dual OB domain-containing protein [Methanococcus maripaludis]|uniref:Dual OB-containing domain-containing protein n=1 Tax=Methanococcus maripaludis OS7 TaxID=637915 RepID=A0A2Z5PVH5_METMI|nr:hypothetical protein [Methanococcus maripaludis]BAP62921.1 hypothetical protein MMOS7_08350 [Methanococcus maripaludis OS7]
MVLKRFVILANSKKYQEHCVAGIDLENGEWIRIINNQNAEKQYAIRDEDLICDCGKKAKVLDIVEVECEKCGADHPTAYYQPENYAMSQDIPWKKVGQFPISNLVNHLSTKLKLWYGGYDRVYPNQLKDDLAPYSLIFIKPEDVKFYLDEREKPRTDFKYRGSNYRRLAITDPAYEYNLDKYPENENYGYVLSLGGLYGANPAHFKLISQIFKL